MKYFLVTGLLFLCSFSVMGQQSSKVKALEQQRKATLAEIETMNKLLSETQQSAQHSLNRLNLLSRQILSRKKVISLLTQEIGEIEKQITECDRDIARLKQELKNKKENYANSAKSIYKRRSSQDKLLFILSADNFAQSYRRMRYLKEYAEWQKKMAAQIINKQQEIQEKQQKLTEIRSEKNSLLSAREEERKKLQNEESGQKKEVQQLKTKQSRLQADLKKKQQQARELERQIERQIAAEIALAEKEANKQTKEKGQSVSGKGEERVAAIKGGYAMTKVERKLSDDFASNKGRLPYPVNGNHTIVSFFGEQQHQDLKYVRMNNNGIDIQTAPGTDACAVFNGVVTRVFVVPGYNNSVIVRHGNYLTVYSNLSQVYVKAGDKVTTRQAIGRIFSDGQDGNSTILHFQLWKEKSKLNPEPWLD